MIVALIDCHRAEDPRWTDLFGTEEFLFFLVFLWLLIQGPGPVSLDNVIVSKQRR